MEAADFSKAYLKFTLCSYIESPGLILSIIARHKPSEMKQMEWHQIWANFSSPQSALWS